MIEHLGGCNEGEPVVPGNLPGACLPLGVLRATVAGDADERRLPEGIGEHRGCVRVVGISADPDGGIPCSVRGHLAPGDLAQALGAAQAAGRDEAALVPVSLTCAGKEHDPRAVLDADLRADDEVNAEPFRLEKGRDNPVEPVPIGERDMRETEGMCLADQLFGAACSLEE